MARINVRILEDRGIYVKGQEVEMARAQGEQWIAGELAEYIPPAAPKPKAEAKPKAKPKAKKEAKKEDDKSS